jgi:hypothetical protein
MGPFLFIGAPGEIRTPDLLVRSQALYPTELRARRVCINARAGRVIAPVTGKAWRGVRILTSE